MDGIGDLVARRRPERREAAQPARRGDAARAFAVLALIALATLAGIVALEACGVAPTVLEAGAIQ